MESSVATRDTARQFSSTPHPQDVALSRAILAGSTAAWQTFIKRYSRLIMAMIRRYVRESDDARSLHAHVLESLYGGGLGHYEGRAALSTWLVAVTRAAVADDLRRRLGRRRWRKQLDRLERYEREVFHHYYLNGLSFGTVLRTVHDNGAQPTPDRLLLALQRIESLVSDRFLRRLRYDLHAQSVGAASGRLLEYLDHVRGEAELLAGVQSPEFGLLEREARHTVEAVMDQVARLPAEDRRLLSLRFEQGWTARRIAEELGLGEQRSVYTRLDRILRGLRRVLAHWGP